MQGSKLTLSCPYSTWAGITGLFWEGHVSSPSTAPYSLQQCHAGTLQPRRSWDLIQAGKASQQLQALEVGWGWSPKLGFAKVSSSEHTFGQPVPCPPLVLSAKSTPASCSRDPRRPFAPIQTDQSGSGKLHKSPKLCKLCSASQKKKKKSGGSNDGTELTRGMVCSVPKLPMIVRQEG